MKKNSKTRVFIINCKKYKLKLINVQYFEAMSDETNAMVGDLWINDGAHDTVIGFENEGRGGSTFLRAYSKEDKEVLNILSNYLSKIPNTRVISYLKQIGMKIDETNPVYFYTPEDLVDEMFDEMLG